MGESSGANTIEGSFPSPSPETLTPYFNQMSGGGSGQPTAAPGGYPQGFYSEFMLPNMPFQPAEPYINPQSGSPATQQSPTPSMAATPNPQQMVTAFGGNSPSTNVITGGSPAATVGTGSPSTNVMMGTDLGAAGSSAGQSMAASPAPGSPPAFNPAMFDQPAGVAPSPWVNNPFPGTGGMNAQLMGPEVRTAAQAQMAGIPDQNLPSGNPMAFG